MSTRSTRSRQALTRAAVALFAALVAFPAIAHWRPPAVGLADIEIRDRTTGSMLVVHEKDGRHYVVGQGGLEYAIHIRNRSAERILAVTSVDGVNVVTGETASVEQSGYVIDAGGSVEIAGWRKSLSRTAAFFFTEHANSYAARTGRPFDVGVIGIAVFAEQVPREMQRIDKPGRAERSHADAALPAAPQGETAAAARAQVPGSMAREPAPTPPVARLGTGHGRNEVSHVRQVAFQRASTAPAQLTSIQYDRLENLVAMGVLPPARIAGSTPRAFPGLRFAPDPR